MDGENLWVFKYEECYNNTFFSSHTNSLVEMHVGFNKLCVSHIFFSVTHSQNSG